MGKLIYSLLTSLDGYTEDERGRFGWGAPEDVEIHSYINALASSLGTDLYGRRMYETMVYWETAHTIPNQPKFAFDCARQWQAAEKIVYSRTLAEPRSARMRVEREFDPDAQMGDPRSEELSRRVAKARERAARERQQRLELAQKELEKLRATKTSQEAQQEARVSETDPEARIMKQADGGFAPSYNVQISTDATHGMIVGVEVSQSATDYGQLVGAVEKVEENFS